MIVYHGSNSNFRQLRIAKSLVKHTSTLDNEGLGIYFSTDKEVAKSYGKYLYTLEINNKYFRDFRNIKTCRQYLALLSQEVYKRFKIDILYFIDMNMIADRMRWGGLAISGVSREVALLLDSNEDWYKLSKTKIQNIYDFLKTYDKNHLSAYMFTYNIQNIGVIKTTKTEVVKIVGKQQSY